MSATGACSDWELVPHAFFDAELNAADSLACELHLGRCQRCSGEMKDLKSMRQKLRRSAIGWDAPDALRSRIGQYRLSKRRSRQVLAEKRASNGFPLGGRRGRLGNRGRGIDYHLRDPSRNHRNQQCERGNPRIEKLYIFLNKTRGSRVSYLAAQFGAVSSQLAPQGRIEMTKKSFEDRGQRLVRRAAARLAISRAVIVAMLIGPIVGAMLATAAVAAQDAASVITIDNFTFAPPELTVAVGTTVKWVNHDDIPHTVVNKDKVFRSKALDTDDSFSFTFASAGTFDYFCGLHPHMVGKVIVK